MDHDDVPIWRVHVHTTASGTSALALDVDGLAALELALTAKGLPWRAELLSVTGDPLAEVRWTSELGRWWRVTADALTDEVVAALLAGTYVARDDTHALQPAAVLDDALERFSGKAWLAPFVEAAAA